MTTQKQIMRKLVRGVGVNDAGYAVSTTANGKRTWCPFYIAWKSMMDRCYSQKLQARQPAYIGCSVANEWVSFANFKAWMETQDWVGNQLDKDILKPGNKVYGPEYCVFVSRQINNVMLDSSSRRGEWPLGVCFNKKLGKFAVGISKGGKTSHIGLFPTPEAAHYAYMIEKAKHIAEVAETQPSHIKAGLLRHADIMLGKSTE